MTIGIKKIEIYIQIHIHLNHLLKRNKKTDITIIKYTHNIFIQSNNQMNKYLLFPEFYKKKEYRVQLLFT